MSLLKQLLISVSVALLGILFGSLALNLDAARSYLSEQLATESENAVSALALSLSQPANQDPVAQELLMSALYDTGHFRSIRMTGPDGALIFVRAQTDTANADVPAWFQSIMPLPVAQSERTVSNGWQQVGTVEVRVDNRLAQTALWHGSMKMFMLIAASGLAWALFVGSLMRWFKRVLQQEIANQVRVIGTDGHLSAPEGSQLQELHAVSSAIADAHARVQQTEKEQMERIDSLELETNCDPLTQLPNRKYFLNELNKQLQRGDAAHGHVFLFRLRDLQAMNSMYSRTEVNEWLRSITQQVQEVLQKRHVQDVHLARLNGSDFAVLLPQMHSLVAMEEVQHLRQLLQTLSLALQPGKWSRWAFTLTPYAQGEKASEVLMRLDQGLMHAENAGHGEVEYAEASERYHNVAHVGEHQWQQVLTQALQTPGQLILDVHALQRISSSGTQLHHEATMELHSADGKVLRASLFLPAAVRLGLMAAFDMKGVALGLEWLAQHHQQTLVVRISMASLDNPFMESLQALLQAHVDTYALDALVLELDAYVLETAADRVQQLHTVLARFGVGLGLRRLEQSPKALLHMSGLGLRYVKLGGFFAEQAQRNLGAQHLLEAMVTTASAQGTAVYITEGVDPAAASKLMQLGASVPHGGS